MLGRGDLNVTGTQVQHWNEQRVFSTAGSWPPTCAATAARVRIALEDDRRDLDAAILNAFQGGADINVRRVRDVLRERVEALQFRLGRAGTSLTRAARLPFPGPSRGQSDDRLRNDLIAVTATGDAPEDPHFLPKLVERIADANARSALENVTG